MFVFQKPCDLQGKHQIVATNQQRSVLVLFTTHRKCSAAKTVSSFILDAQQTHLWLEIAQIEQWLQQRSISSRLWKISGLHSSLFSGEEGKVKLLHEHYCRGKCYFGSQEQTILLLQLFRHFSFPALFQVFYSSVLVFQYAQHTNDGIGLEGI